MVGAAHRGGERMAVAVSFGVSHRARIDLVGVDLDLRPERVVDAYAAGRRSVAVTSSAVQALIARRLRPGQIEALMLPELGHHTPVRGFGSGSDNELARRSVLERCDRLDPCCERIGGIHDGFDACRFAEGDESAHFVERSHGGADDGDL